MKKIELQPKQINISLDETDFNTLKDMCDDAIRYRAEKSEWGVAKLYYNIYKNLMYASFDKQKQSNL